MDENQKVGISKRDVELMSILWRCDDAGENIVACRQKLRQQLLEEVHGKGSLSYRKRKLKKKIKLLNFFCVGSTVATAAFHLITTYIFC